MLDINIELDEVSNEPYIHDIVKECEQFRESIGKKLELLKVHNDEHKQKIEAEVLRLKEERETLEKEKLMWQKEKERIQEIQPINDIVKLSVSGTPLEVRRSTLQHVPGSSLDALFSGRHTLQTNEDGRIFIDRNFNSFNAIIDFIRNGGQFFGSNKEQKDAFENELHFWGISRSDFKRPQKDQFDLIQEMIDKPLSDFFIDQNNFGLRRFFEKRINFKDACQKGKFDVNNDFTIRQISEVCSLKSGSEIIHFGKIFGFENKDNCMELKGVGIGQIKQRNHGFFNLEKGYGEYYGKNQFYLGECQDGACQGQGRFEYSDGKLLEGLFENDIFKQGKITYPDGTCQQGEFRFNAVTNQYEQVQN